MARCGADRSEDQPAVAFPRHRSSTVVGSSESRREMPREQRDGSFVAAPGKLEELADSLEARLLAEWTELCGQGCDGEARGVLLLAADRAPLRHLREVHWA
eukprot:310523-Pyramimonas_sp.AAC.1